MISTVDVMLPMLQFLPFCQMQMLWNFLQFSLHPEHWNYFFFFFVSFFIWLIVCSPFQKISPGSWILFSFTLLLMILFFHVFYAFLPILQFFCFFLSLFSSFKTRDFLLCVCHLNWTADKISYSKHTQTYLW